MKNYEDKLVFTLGSYFKKNNLTSSDKPQTNGHQEVMKAKLRTC